MPQTRHKKWQRQFTCIPVVFEFTTATEVRWTAANGWIYGWDGYDFAAKMRIESSGEERELRYERDDVPRELRDRCDEALGNNASNVLFHPGGTSHTRVWDESVQRICLEFPLELLICDADWPGTKADAWAMRDAFLRVGPDKKSVLNFLNRWGTWDEKNYLRVSDFLSFQEKTRAALLLAPEEWFNDFQENPFDTLERQAEYPHFAIRTSSCREAILATITVDKLRGTKFAICARRDCLNPPFEITRPDRAYCCQYCAHLESIRRKARKKKSRRKK